jgi:hypothetical protein
MGYRRRVGEPTSVFGPGISRSAWRQHVLHIDPSTGCRLALAQVVAAVALWQCVVSGPLLWARRLLYRWRCVVWLRGFVLCRPIADRKYRLSLLFASSSAAATYYHHLKAKSASRLALLACCLRLADLCPQYYIYNLYCIAKATDIATPATSPSPTAAAAAIYYGLRTTGSGLWCSWLLLGCATGVWVWGLLLLAWLLGPGVCHTAGVVCGVATAVGRAVGRGPGFRLRWLWLW